MKPKTTRQSLGGVARSRSLTPRRRSLIARKGGIARWQTIDPRKVLNDGLLIGEVCRRYSIEVLYAFGSILGNQFKPESDVDLMYEGRLRLEDYLKAVNDFKKIFGRNIDLANKAVIMRDRERIRQRHILATAEQIYAKA